MPLTFTDSRVLSGQELSRLAAAIAGTYVVPTASGGAVSTSAAMTVAVAAITASTGLYVNGVQDTTGYAGGTTVIAIADVTNPRRDYVWTDGAGAIGNTTGTPAANPVLPDLTAGRIALAEIYVTAGLTTIASANIIDRRANKAAGDFTWIRKAANQTINNSVTLTNDTDFAFTVTASHDYVVEMFLITTSSSATPDLQFAWTLTNMTWDGIYPSSGPGNGLPGYTSTSGVTSASAKTMTSANTPASSPLWLSFIIHAGSTGGTLNFQWAQNTQTVEDTKLLKNSWLRYRDLGAS